MQHVNKSGGEHSEVQNNYQREKYIFQEHNLMRDMKSQYKMSCSIIIIS